MFKENKYTQIYYNIINRAKSRNLDGYVEQHHIIPKSLGGSDDSTNIAVLTAKEHYICHLLLTKMTAGINRQKMFYALHRLTNHSDRKVSSRIYQYLRENHAVLVSKKFKNKTYEETRGKPYAHEISEYQRQRIRESNTARVWSEKSKRKVSESQKRRYRERPESFNTLPKTESHKQKLSESRKRNANKYTFIHSDGSVFTGTTGDLARLVGSNSAEPWKLVVGQYKTHKGWRVA